MCTITPQKNRNKLVVVSEPRDRHKTCIHVGNLRGQGVCEKVNSLSSKPVVEKNKRKHSRTKNPHANRGKCRYAPPKRCSGAHVRGEQGQRHLGVLVVSGSRGGAQIPLARQKTVRNWLNCGGLLANTRTCVEQISFLNLNVAFNCKRIKNAFHA